MLGISTTKSYVSIKESIGRSLRTPHYVGIKKKTKKNGNRESRIENRGTSRGCTSQSLGIVRAKALKCLIFSYFRENSKGYYLYFSSKMLHFQLFSCKF